MSGKDLSKDILHVVKNKTGKTVTEQDIKKIASGVKPSTVQSEVELRRLIKQVSNMVNIPVAESTVKDIVDAVKKSGLNANSMEQVMKAMMGRK